MSRLARTLRMIRVEHSVFALPFALAGAWLAAGGVPRWTDLALLVAAAVAARSAAMAFNRLVDAPFDAANPRTAAREIPRGRISPAFAAGFTLACSIAFVGAAYLLAPLCGALALPVLAVLLGYSYLKRWTWLCHAGLGLALACAPAGAWLAVRKEFAPDWWLPLALGGGVLAWVAGFDLLYSLQDAEHDRRSGLRSFPAQFGSRATLALSAVLFASALALWAWTGHAASLRWPFWLGWSLVAGLLAAEQVLVRHGGLARVPTAFFTLNAWVGPVFFLGLAGALPGASVAQVA